MLARTLGEKNDEKAKNVIVNGILLTFISWIIIAILSIFGLKAFFKSFTQNENFIFLGSTYLYIVSIFSIGTVFQILFEKILEAYGKTKESMIVQISGSVINLILDPIFIYGMFGIKALGVKGAAIATVTGQTIGMFIGLGYLLKLKVFPKLKELQFNREMVKQIYKVGFPTMILESLSSFITIIVNKILIGFSDLAVSVWGIYVRVQQFIFIIIYGLNYGMIPIVAYNYGAKRKDRVMDAIRYFLKLAIAVAIIGMLVFFILPKQIINIFGVSEETMQIGIIAFRILSIGFVFSGISLVLSATFQSLGNGTYSLVISLSRKIIFVLPTILLLKNILGIIAIWLSFVLAEVITMMIAVYIFRKKFYAELKNDMNS